MKQDLNDIYVLLYRKSYSPNGYMGLQQVFNKYLDMKLPIYLLTIFIKCLSFTRTPISNG